MLQMRLHNITMNSMKNRYTFLEDNIYLKIFTQNVFGVFKL